MEGQDAVFTLTASPVNHAQATVNYRMKGRAILGTDYTLSGATGQVTIPAGQASVTVTLHSLEDASKERGNEHAAMTLQKGAGYKLGALKKAAVLITDD
jgi:hypothetical protein